MNKKMKKVLILCTGNSCRSQIAEGYFRLFSENKAEIFSAGIEVHGLNPLAVQVMKEDSIDISGQFSKSLDSLKDQFFDYVVTVCDNAKESCPVFPGSTNIFHRDFEDPARFNGSKEDKLDKFREVRKKIKTFAYEFVEENLT